MLIQAGIKRFPPALEFFSCFHVILRYMGGRILRAVDRTSLGGSAPFQEL